MDSACHPLGERSFTPGGESELPYSTVWHAHMNTTYFRPYPSAFIKKFTSSVISDYLRLLQIPLKKHWSKIPAFGTSSLHPTSVLDVIHSEGTLCLSVAHVCWTYIGHQRWMTPVGSSSDSDSRPIFWLRLRPRLQLSKNSLLWFRLWLNSKLAKNGVNSRFNSYSEVGIAHLWIWAPPQLYRLTGATLWTTKRHCAPLKRIVQNF